MHRRSRARAGRHPGRAGPSSCEGPQEPDEATLCRALPGACFGAGSAGLPCHHQAAAGPHEHPAAPGEQRIHLARSSSPLLQEQEQGTLPASGRTSWTVKA